MDKRFFGLAGLPPGLDAARMEGEERRQPKAAMIRRGTPTHFPA